MEKTLNNTQKLSDHLNMTTLNVNQTRLSNNSSQACFNQPVTLGTHKEKVFAGKPSSNSQFDWTGLLANLHLEALKPKKSTSIQK
jgi:hypothetical protein